MTYIPNPTKVFRDSSRASLVKAVPAQVDRIGFTKAISGGIDTTWGELRVTGSGMTVNQTGGNLVITSGTTARSETIIRSTASYIGAVRLRARSTLSQRIANNNFFVELVDVIGDDLAYTINSATSLTVTLPGNTFTSENVGQSMYIGAFSGTGTFLSGRYVIASVSGDDITFTVSGFAVGSGTCSLFGWNYYQLQYQGVTATQVNFDTQRNGYATGATAATINTTASPGHLAVVTGNDLVATFADQLVATGATIKQTVRATRDENIPDDKTLRLQIRVVNGTTNPASSTTWTIGFVGVTEFDTQDVSVQDVRPMGVGSALPVEIMRTSVTQAVSGSVTATVAAATLALPTIVADVASAAITTTTTTAAFTPTAGNSYQVNIPVTVVSGTTPTLTVRIEESDNSGTNWFERYTFPTITTTGIYRSPILKLRGNRVRYVQTITGTTPSFTRAINRLQRQDAAVSGAPGKIISAASTNATLLRGAPCELVEVSISNVNAAARYVKFYDKATSPTVGTDTPVATYVVPGATTGGVSNIQISAPKGFHLGCGLAITGGIADSDTTAVSANDVAVSYSLA